MQRISLLALFVAMAMAVAMAAEKTIMDGQIEVKITGKGGGLTLTAKAMNDEDDDKDNGGSDKDVATTAEPEAGTTAEPADGAGDSGDNNGNRKRRAAEESKDNVVKIMLNSLKEVDKDGNEVGTTKTNKQNVGDFKAVKFTIGVAKEDSMIPNSKNSEEKEITAVEIAYEASVGTGKVQINVYIAKEAGNITLGSEPNTEKTMVEKGQIKFTVQIEGWEWCTEDDANCVVEETKEVGASLDLAITVKGEGKATLNDAVDGMAPSYDIGNKNMLYVSNMIKKTADDEDNSEEWVKMADDYPKADPKDDGTTMMTMRFPMFGKSIWYDPSVRLAIPGGEGVSSSNMITASLAVVMLTLLAAFIRL